MSDPHTAFYNRILLMIVSALRNRLGINLSVQSYSLSMAQLHLLRTMRQIYLQLMNTFTYHNVCQPRGKGVWKRRWCFLLDCTFRQSTCSPRGFSHFSGTQDIAEFFFPIKSNYKIKKTLKKWGECSPFLTYFISGFLSTDRSEVNTLQQQVVNCDIQPIADCISRYAVSHRIKHSRGFGDTLQSHPYSPLCIAAKVTFICKCNAKYFLASTEL